MGLFGSKLKCALMIQPVIDPCAQQCGPGGLGHMGGFGGNCNFNGQNCCPGATAVRIGKANCKC